MKYILPIRSGASVTGANTDTLQLGEFYSSGSGTNALKVSWATQYKDGTITSIKLQHSSDGSTWADLWDLGNTTAAHSEKVFYTWNPYIRALYSYTVGTSTEDAGFRFKFTLEPYGMPGWAGNFLFRSEHTDAIFPILTDTAKGFPASWDKQRDAAKRTIYTVLCAKGIDPDALTTDGHKTEPVVEHLAMAGAALCLYYALLGSNAVRSEVYDNNLKALWERYTDFLTTATEGNVLAQDDGDAKPDSSDMVFRPAAIHV